MKYVIYMTLLLMTGYGNYAASPGSSPALYPFSTTTAPRYTVQEQLRIAQMRAFTQLTVKDYEKLKGKKMNFLEKFTFRVSQRRMKKMLQQYEYGEVTTLSKISWFLKGLVLGPIAVALAYAFLQDEQRELIKWTWFGFATLAVAIIVLLLVL